MLKVNLIDFVLLWAQSLQGWLQGQDIVLRFGQSPGDRLKRSCWVNLRRSGREAELLLWESGEAELNSSDPNRGVSQKHYEIHDDAELGQLLSQLLNAMK